MYNENTPLRRTLYLTQLEQIKTEPKHGFYAYNKIVRIFMRLSIELKG
jgi:hypothetical protein